MVRRLKLPVVVHQYLALVLVSLLLCASAFVHADNYQQQKQKLDQLRKQVISIQGSLKSQLKIQDSTTRELKQIEVSVGQLNQKIRHLKSEIKNNQAQLNDLQAEQNQVLGQKQSQQKLIETQLLAAYKLGREQQLKLLLNEENPSQVQRLMHYHQQFIHARTTKIDEYLTTMQKLAAIEEQITRSQEQLKSQKKNLDQRHQELGQKIKNRKLTLARVNNKIQDDQQQLNKLKNEQSALESIIQKLEQAVANLSHPNSDKPFSKMKGKLPKPVSGYLKHRFGQTKQANIPWNGWYLTANEGAPVQAVHHGHIVFSDYLRGYGLLLIIDHGQGYMSLYAHNQVLLKEAGDWINSGETIARVGDTGGLGEHALYFEIRYNGKPQNPSRWLRR